MFIKCYTKVFLRVSCPVRTNLYNLYIYIYIYNKESKKIYYPYKAPLVVLMPLSSVSNNFISMYYSIVCIRREPNNFEVLRGIFYILKVTKLYTIYYYYY